MPTYDIDGVPVEFPYDAYACQIEYMRAVVKALESGNNALLESPTGTGKTLCLLCATLGWRRHRQESVTHASRSWEAQADANVPRSVPKIWYSSRTHTQLRQVMAELKRTSYKPSSVVLGSRQHFCIHPSVSRQTGPRQNAMCRRAVDEHKCGYHTGFRKCGGKVSTALKDIEEITASCKEANVCPFYKVREDAKEAELLLIPYDYLIGTQTRESIQVPLRNSILIFDEGHNIEKSCEENASFQLTQKDISGAIAELEDAFAIVEAGQNNLDAALPDETDDMFLKSVNIVKCHLLALDDSIRAQKLVTDGISEKRILKARGSYILELLQRSSDRGQGVSSKEEVKHLINVVKKTISVLTFGQETASSGGLYLDKIQHLFSTAFKLASADLDHHYQVLVYEDSADADKRGAKRKAVDFFADTALSSSGETPRTLCLWCFSCSVTMKELMQHEVHSVIITSGTLSPIQSTADAFGVPFPVILENSHVIDPGRQLWGGVLTAGPDKVCLDASFDKRQDLTYLRDLGSTIQRIAAVVPDGLLLAFASYAQKENILQAWRNSGQLDEINRVKPLFEEPKGNTETKVLLEQYSAALDKKPSAGVGGAILAAVCRGKLCEGIDFTDRQCRMVVIVGIPYPSKNELKVVLKQDFLDGKGSAGDGRRWYQREAIRAVNQTLGRVIRHRNDFGGVLLCDQRYARGTGLSLVAQGLSSWMRPRVSVFGGFDSALGGCRRFFGTTASLELSASPASGKNAGSGSLGSSRTASSSSKRQASDSKGPSLNNKGKSRSLSILSALWRGEKSQASAATGSPASSASSRAPATPQAVPATPQAIPATPQAVPATPQAVQLQSQEPRSAAALASAPAPAMQSAAGVQRARGKPGGTPSLALAMDAPTSRWLKAVEALLPRMELDAVRQHLSASQSEATLIATGQAEASDVKLMQSLRQIAESLLPEMCFDTPEQEKRRESLVREAAQLWPKLLRPLWKVAVDETLKAHGSSRKIWG
eukprot:TRINITY_DN90066_c0_g1_i1.p1 TRINITY_DN90066_c0_g1~~TRINITY_DN90066_c0_g1_i1.p1  ORF type:complete len:998 (+),score=143.61 TRINITY_DN90066_c0_g1_i1:56-3049(+)